jgi:homoserine dehydrogenase
MKKVNIGILGLGTVGAGVYRLLRKNKELIRKKSCIDIVVRRIADIDDGMKSAHSVPDSVFTTSAEELINDPDVDIVVELIGGTTLSKELMLRAIRNKKHIVTANKALFAEHGKEILREVLKNEVEIGYEASVGGGIPIIKTIREALVGNQIQKIIGIVNGTTNFILTKMTKEGLDFKEALSKAQEMGFAEADPHLDISGGDARHKITILSSLAFNTLVDINEVYVEGIERIDKKDIEYSWEFGFVLKLLAIAERYESGVLVKVHPALVSKENPLAGVSWEDNAIMVYSDFLGKSMYYGKGAGSHPTASAVVADITDIALKITSNIEYNKNCYTFFQHLEQIDFQESRTRYYFRFSALDRPGILSKISGVLGRNNISIASVIQKETEEEHEHVPLVMLTHTALEKDVREAVREIDKFEEIAGKSKIIRVIDDEKS